MLKRRITSVFSSKLSRSADNVLMNKPSFLEFLPLIAALVVTVLAEHEGLKTHVVFIILVP